MARLPQQHAPLVYGIIQDMRLVEEWLFAWGLAFLTMLPVVVFVSPFIQRCVLALTVSTADDG
jgi:hypothetical protein